jgi:hypothetical protein
VFGRLANKSVKCDRASCDYSIQLESPLGLQALINVLRRLHIRSDLLSRTLLGLGTRPALVNAQMGVSCAMQM